MRPVYLDTSVIVPIFTIDYFSKRITDYFKTARAQFYVSNFAAVEFSSVIAMRVRMREINETDALKVFLNFDLWFRSKIRNVEIIQADINAAEAFLRRLNLTLRAADAIHIAIAQRLDSTLMTFDNKMAANARSIGIDVADA